MQKHFAGRQSEIINRAGMVIEIREGGYDREINSPGGENVGTDDVNCRKTGLHKRSDFLSCGNWYFKGTISFCLWQW